MGINDAAAAGTSIGGNMGNNHKFNEARSAAPPGLFDH
eukprot:SAG22_NODE_334_length_12094_cov_9.446019_6_plen_38_part_00